MCGTQRVRRRSECSETRHQGKRELSPNPKSPTQVSRAKMPKLTSNGSTPTTNLESPSPSALLDMNEATQVATQPTAPVVHESSSLVATLADTIDSDRSSLPIAPTTGTNQGGSLFAAPSTTATDLANHSVDAPITPDPDLSGHLARILLSVNDETAFQKLLEDLQKGWESKKAEMSTGQPAARKFSSIADIRQYWKEIPVFKPNLLGLPPHVKTNIFTNVLLKQDANVTTALEICPFYHQGYMPDSSAFNDLELHVIERYGVPPVYPNSRPNLDLALLGVNKHLRNFCSKIFYPNHTFIFNDARSCMWFLQRIGKENVRNLSSAVFNLSSGFFLSKEYEGRLNVCEEQRWVEIFSYLRDIQGLRKCVIRFFRFNGLQARKDLTDNDKKEVTKGRLDLVAVISGFRDLEYVRIENEHCEFLGLYERQQMAMMMTTKAEECPVGCFDMEKSKFDSLV